MDERNSSAGGGARPPLFKRILFTVFAALLLLAIVEVVAFLGSSAVDGERFSWSREQQARAELLDRTAGGAPDGTDAAREVPHPYLGYVRNPDRVPTVSQFGYP